jgi:catechol 2,3-dioxygenase
VSDPASSPIDPALKIAAVQLAVSDLAASADFYERVLGLSALEQDTRHAVLGVADERPALELQALERAVAVAPGCSGLYHVAWLHPSRAALAETARRVAAAGWPFQGASDHGVSEALYLADPDGLGIEIYADRPRAGWRRAPDGRGVEMVTLPLDVEDLLAQWPDAPGATLAPGAGIGHVHLKVADVPRAASFYEQLGFEPQALLPGAAFVSAGGYHHHLGLNSWQSAGGAPAPEHAPGLRAIDFRLSGRDALQQLAASTTRLGGGASRDEQGALVLRDPDGQLLRFTAS